MSLNKLYHVISRWPWRKHGA